MEQFNESLFNQDTLIEGIEKGIIEFDGYNLMSICNGVGINQTGIGVLQANPYDLNNIDISAFASSLTDGGGVYNRKYGNKQVRITLFMQGENHEDLINRLDELKSRLQGVEKDFDILVNGEYRTYKATISNITVPSFGKTDDFIEGIEVDMIITSPHWEIKTEDYVFTGDITENAEILSFNAGNYETFPRILFVVKNSGNNLTQIDIESKNILETSTNTLTITEIIEDNDILEVNYKTKQVLLNGNEVPFTGVMTPMIPGYNSFDFIFTGTVNCDITILHNKTFL